MADDRRLATRHGDLQAYLVVFVFELGRAAFFERFEQALELIKRKLHGLNFSCAEGATLERAVARQNRPVRSREREVTHTNRA
jgi:hypothetical protein